MIPDDVYKEYCRCWRVYLDNVNTQQQPTTGQQQFVDSLFLKINPRWNIFGVYRWPTVWPEAEIWFDGIEKFNEAVQEAEKHLKEQT